MFITKLVCDILFKGTYQLQTSDLYVVITQSYLVMDYIMEANGDIEILSFTLLSSFILLICTNKK